MYSKVQKKQLLSFFNRQFSMFVIVVLSIFNAHATTTFSSVEDKITLEAQNQSLLEILSSIENQSSITFVYGDNVKRLSKTHSITYHQEDLNTVLNDLAEQFDITYIKNDTTVSVSLD